MIWRVEIKQKSGLLDSAGQAVLKDIADLGVGSLSNVRVVSVYLLEGNISREDVKRICEELLVDPIVEEYGFSLSAPQSSSNCHIVEIAYNPGVMDPVEASTIKGIRDLGIEGIVALRTARQYHLYGSLSEKDSEQITSRVLMNKLIQHSVKTAAQAIPTTLTLAATVKSKFDVVIVDLLKANDKDLMKLSSVGQLYLNLNEMKAIQAHFKKENRNPTDVELETIAQTWSEHCNHKTFRGIIRYRQGKTGKAKIIKSLFKTTIAKVTNDLKKKWCISVFHDNAGVLPLIETITSVLRWKRIITPQR